jgi:hypothetical protein
MEDIVGKTSARRVWKRASVPMSILSQSNQAEMQSEETHQTLSWTSVLFSVTYIYFTTISLAWPFSSLNQGCSWARARFFQWQGPTVAHLMKSVTSYIKSVRLLTLLVSFISVGCTSISHFKYVHLFQFSLSSNAFTSKWLKLWVISKFLLILWRNKLIKIMKSSAFCDITPYSPLKVSWQFLEICRLHLQTEKKNLSKQPTRKCSKQSRTPASGSNDK